MNPEVSPLILALDDEAGILRLLNLELSMQGFKVQTTQSAQEARRIVEQFRPDLILLDIVMPEETGIEFLRKHLEGSDIPVIFVTAKSHDHDIVRGLELGADDYVVKPFSPDELGARIRAVLRRTGKRSTEDRQVNFGEFTVDLNNRTLTKDGQRVSLTATEWQLLAVFAGSPNKIFLGSELLTRVWGPEYRDDLIYLRHWIGKLRRKMGDWNKEVIKTVNGIGYILEVPPPFH